MPYVYWEFKTENGPKKVRKIKEALGESLSIQNNATITVTELTCLEEGYPPVETVVALLKTGSDPLQHKIHKPAAEFKAADLTEIAVRFTFGADLQAKTQKCRAILSSRLRYHSIRKELY